MVKRRFFIEENGEVVAEMTFTFGLVKTKL